MPSIVDSLNLISKTMESILDFVANDEVLSKDFQQYLEINNIQIETEKDFNNIIIQYMLDMKMQNGLRVLEYYRRNNQTYEEIISALENSVCSVFKIDKILTNAYEATCLTSNAKVTLIPMVKMSHLKQIGRFDNISARIIELDNTQYILEIYDVISEIPLRKETDWFKYDNVLSKYWTRKGPYLFPKMNEEMYKKFVAHCLDCSILINPEYNNPSIIPFGADIGVFTKLKNNPFDF